MPRRPHCSVFGRDADIAALTARVRGRPLVVVVGPSGVGNSSLVQAGLIPALLEQRGGRWRWSALARPLAAARRRAAPSGEWLRCGGHAGGVSAREGSAPRGGTSTDGSVLE